MVSAFMVTHVPVGELLVCKGAPRNTLDMCRGSKDRRLSNTEQVVTRLPRVTCRYQTRRLSHAE